MDDAPVANATVQEVEAAIDAMSDHDWLRLGRSASYLAVGLDVWEGDALLNEALMRTLAATRKWPKGVKFTTFVYGVMRSIADEVLEKREVRPEVPASAASPAIEEQDGDVIERTASSRLRPDVEVAHKLEAAELTRRIENKFADNDAATAVIMGLLDGMSKTETMHMFGLSSTQYDSARRAIRRARLDILGSGGKS